MTYYKSEAEFNGGEPCVQKFVLTGAESLPDVDVGKRKYALNIILPSSDETGEIRLVFENVRSLFLLLLSFVWTGRIEGKTTTTVCKVVVRGGLFFFLEN